MAIMDAIQKKMFFLGSIFLDFQYVVQYSGKPLWWHDQMSHGDQGYDTHIVKSIWPMKAGRMRCDIISLVWAVSGFYS